MSENKSINGAFRKKKLYFSQVSNVALRDNSLSLKAKGLYALIQSYITIEDFTLYKTTLKKQCSEGDKAFESTWKELKDAGYLIQYRFQDKTVGENGKVSNHFYYEYELLDEPNTELANKIHGAQNRKKEEDKTHNPKTEGMDKIQPKTHNPKTEGMDNGGDAKGGVYNNTNYNNTDLNNTDFKTTTTVVVVPDEIKAQYKLYFGKKANYPTLKKISTYLEKFEVDAITYAFDRAANKGQDFGYAVGILKNWANAGTFTFEEVVVSDNGLI